MFHPQTTRNPVSKPGVDRAAGTPGPGQNQAAAHIPMGTVGNAAPIGVEVQAVTPETAAMLRLLDLLIARCERDEAHRAYSFGALGSARYGRGLRARRVAAWSLPPLESGRADPLDELAGIPVAVTVDYDTPHNVGLLGTGCIHQDERCAGRAGIERQAA
jgi:hypothetical protein